MFEMVQVLANVPRNRVLGHLRESPFFSLLIDETTDVAVTKQLIFFARYLHKNKVVNSEIAATAIASLYLLLHEYMCILKSLYVDYNLRIHLSWE